MSSNDNVNSTSTSNNCMRDLLFQVGSALEMTQVEIMRNWTNTMIESIYFPSNPLLFLTLECFPNNLELNLFGVRIYSQGKYAKHGIRQHSRYRAYRKQPKYSNCRKHGMDRRIAIKFMYNIATFIYYIEYLY